jgi:hypothetical protein
MIYYLWVLEHEVSIDAGPTGFPSDMITSCGLWPGPRTKAARGAATATPNLSIICHTSRTPIVKYLLYLDQDTFFGSDKDYNHTIVFSIDIKRDSRHPCKEEHNIPINPTQKVKRQLDVKAITRSRSSARTSINRLSLAFTVEFRTSRNPNNCLRYPCDRLSVVKHWQLEH